MSVLPVRSMGSALTSWIKAKCKVNAMKKQLCSLVARLVRQQLRGEAVSSWHRCERAVLDAGRQSQVLPLERAGPQDHLLLSAVQKRLQPSPECI